MKSAPLEQISKNITFALRWKNRTVRMVALTALAGKYQNET
jgi:hypothetical protein